MVPPARGQRRQLVRRGESLQQLRAEQRVHVHALVRAAHGEARRVVRHAVAFHLDGNMEKFIVCSMVVGGCPYTDDKRTNRQRELSLTLYE